MGAPDPSTGTLLPFLPSPTPGKEALRPAGLCVSLPSARPHSSGQSLGGGQCFRGSAQHPSPASLSASQHRCPPGSCSSPAWPCCGKRQEGWGSSRPSEAATVVKAVPSFPVALRHVPQPPGFLLCCVCVCVSWVLWSQWLQENLCGKSMLEATY